MMESRFHVNTSLPTSKQNHCRYRATLAFIQDLHGKVLDAGDRNPFNDQIERKFGVTLTSTKGDLDEIELPKEYDFITCFEVLEHLMNPLWFLRQAKKSLKPQGVLYLSTPINKPKFLWRDDHFHEFDELRLLALVDKADFEVVRSQRMRCYKLTGFRPMLRYLFKTGTLLLELKPKT